MQGEYTVNPDPDPLGITGMLWLQAGSIKVWMRTAGLYVAYDVATSFVHHNSGCLPRNLYLCRWQVGQGPST